MNYIFWDIESSGSRTAWDAIVEFGAVLTDDRFKELDRFNIRCRLKPTVIPDIGALLVNKSSVQMLKNSNLSHHQLIREVQKIFSKWSPAIFASYNGISFDEEFLRKSYFKNLIPNVYQTNTNGNKRIDILNVVRAGKLVKDSVIKTTISEKGNPVFKLDQLTVANKIEHKGAHGALPDALATKSVAELVYRDINDVWKGSLTTTSKADTESFIENNKIFSSVEYFYGRARFFLCTHLFYHPNYKWSICFDLKWHPKDYVNMNRYALSEAIKKSPKILRTVRQNKSPIILDSSYSLKEEPYCKISQKEIDSRLDLLKKNGAQFIFMHCNSTYPAPYKDINLNYDYNALELSIRQTLGDINEDGEINIQDVILLVNLVLSNEYNDLADMNGDSIVNVIDVVQLVNIILIEDDTPIYSNNPDMNGQFLDAVLINRNPDCRAYTLDANDGDYGSSLILDISNLILMELREMESHNVERIISMTQRQCLSDACVNHIQVSRDDAYIFRTGYIDHDIVIVSNFPSPTPTCWTNQIKYIHIIIIILHLPPHMSHPAKLVQISIGISR